MTGSDNGDAVWLLESTVTYWPNMDDTATISSYLDADLLTVYLLSVALHGLFEWNGVMLHCHCLLLHVLFTSHCNVGLGCRTRTDPHE